MAYKPPFEPTNEITSTALDIAEAVEMTKCTMERMIVLLKEDGRVRRVDSPRAGHWEIL